MTEEAVVNSVSMACGLVLPIGARAFVQAEGGDDGLQRAARQSKVSTIATTSVGVMRGYTARGSDLRCPGRRGSRRAVRASGSAGASPSQTILTIRPRAV